MTDSVDLRDYQGVLEQAVVRAWPGDRVDQANDFALGRIGGLLSCACKLAQMEPPQDVVPCPLLHHLF